MRYERRSYYSDEKSPSRFHGSRRTKVLGLVGLLVLLGGTAAILGVTLGGSPPAVRPSKQVPIIKAMFSTASVFLENIGVPNPSGVTNNSWSLTGDPLKTSGSSSRLSIPEHAWMVGEKIVPLSSAEATQITSAQSPIISRFFAGSYLSLVRSQLDSAIADEKGTAKQLSSPGGARIQSWSSVTVHGATTHVDAIVSFWEQQDTIVAGPPFRRVDPGIQTGIVESVANLQKIDGTWKITSLVNSPWQQAT